MGKKTTISLRAFFLLLVFFLNTGIGFACAIRSGLWSDRQHNMHDMHAVHHKTPKNAHQCCGDGMVKFEQLDKSNVQNDETVQLPMQVSLYPVLYLPRYFLHLPARVHTHVILQQYPPPHDIRVSIQSFQI